MTTIETLVVSILATTIGGVVVHHLTKRHYRTIEHREFHLRQKKNRLKAKLQTICPHIDRKNGIMIHGIRSDRQAYSHGVCVYCDQPLPVAKEIQNLSRLKEQAIRARRNHLMHRLDALGDWRQHSTIPTATNPVPNAPSSPKMTIRGTLR